MLNISLMSSNMLVVKGGNSSSVILFSWLAKAISCLYSRESSPIES